MEKGFDTAKYIDSQIRHIENKINQMEGTQVFVEFGGKPFGDYHAARVLPGYDPDCKSKLLKELMPACDIVMVVNAKDILIPEYGRTLQGRIRGDSGLRYDIETIRLIRQARKLKLDIADVVLAVSPRKPDYIDSAAIETFREQLTGEGVTLHANYEADGYPDPAIFSNPNEAFGQNDIVARDKHVVIFSPGGGSGKFGFILSEMYYALLRGKTPSFLKFETFPIYNEKPEHPLNLAFEAATADLQNRVISICSSPVLGEVTSYDKDIENFALLKKLFSLSFEVEGNIEALVNPTSMGVNRITDGIVSPELITIACGIEINRRVDRYRDEVIRGLEKPSTLDRAVYIRDFFQQRYGGIVSNLPISPKL